MCHAAVPLSNGQVLLVGGGTGDTSGGALAAAELDNPATRMWTLTGARRTARRNPARRDHSATRPQHPDE